MSMMNEWMDAYGTIDKQDQSILRQAAVLELEARGALSDRIDDVDYEMSKLWRFNDHDMNKTVQEAHDIVLARGK
jgi:hypothetical protein